MGDRADMVFMGMGDHQTVEPVAAGDGEFGIGRQNIDPGRGLITEGDTEIDSKPAAPATIEAEIHADLASPSQRYKQQLIADIFH
jgi:hypothetical protein